AAGGQRRAHDDFERHRHLFQRHARLPVRGRLFRQPRHMHEARAGVALPPQGVHQRVENLVADIGARRLRNVRRDAGALQFQQCRLDGQGREECRGAAAQHRHVHWLRAGVVRNARVDHVDRHALQRNAVAPTGKAHRDRHVRLVPAYRAPQGRQRSIELAGKLRDHHAMVFDGGAAERAHGLPRRVDRFAAERRKAGQQHGAFVLACNAVQKRKISRYIRIKFTTSSSAPVFHCARITSFWFGSSSRATGTMLKLAAIGVNSVPQYPVTMPSAPRIAGFAPCWWISNGMPMPAISTGKAAKALPMMTVNSTMPSPNATTQASALLTGISRRTRSATAVPTPVAANTPPSAASVNGSSAAQPSVSSSRRPSDNPASGRARVTHSAAISAATQASASPVRVMRVGSNRCTPPTTMYAPNKATSSVTSGISKAGPNSLWRRRNASASRSAVSRSLRFPRVMRGDKAARAITQTPASCAGSALCAADAASTNLPPAIRTASTPQNAACDQRRPRRLRIAVPARNNAISQ